MEIPLELMITIRQKHPWMFFPDVVPIGHPIFDIINSTDPEVMCYSISKLSSFSQGPLIVDKCCILFSFCDYTDRLGSQISVSSVILF